MPKLLTRTVKLALMLKVSRYGSGYYMRIPTDIAQSMKMESGDRVELRIEKIIPKEVKMLADSD